jgi:hypothetical protein
MKKKERKKESQKPEERKQTSLFKRETLSLPEEATELEVESKCCFLAINGESCMYVFRGKWRWVRKSLASLHRPNVLN